MCLKCLVPGTGTGDAPRAFSLKLGKVTTSAECGYKPLTMDPQTEVKHYKGQLIGIAAKHVDDIKLGATRTEIDHYKKCLTRVFGELDCREKEFECTGIRHKQTEDGSVVMDQTEYVKGFKPITHAELTGRKAEDPTTPCSSC